MMANDQALLGQPSHLANGNRGRSQLLPYQPHGFTSLPKEKLSIETCFEWKSCKEIATTFLQKKQIVLLFCFPIL